jgi:hypothetical protein
MTVLGKIGSGLKAAFTIHKPTTTETAMTEPAATVIQPSDHAKVAITYPIPPPAAPVIAPQMTPLHHTLSSIVPTATTSEALILTQVAPPAATPAPVVPTLTSTASTVPATPAPVVAPAASTTTTPPRPTSTVAADLEQALKNVGSTIVFDAEFVENWIKTNYSKIEAAAKADFQVAYTATKAEATKVLNDLVAEYNVAHTWLKTEVEKVL